MSSTNKDRYYTSNVGKSRRSSPGESQGSIFFQTGQGGRTVLPPISDAFPTSRFPGTYSNQFTQPRSSPARYDLNPQALYNQWPQTSQLTPSFPNYETHDRFSAQQTYTNYPSRSSSPLLSNQADRRRLPPLSTSPGLGGERWQQPAYGMPPPSHFPGGDIRSPSASYAMPAYLPYPTSQNHQYSYPDHHEHMTMNPSQQSMMFDVERGDIRSSSALSRGSSQISPPGYTPPPVSPTSPEEPTIKKKRKRADAAQLKVLNETYARTAFPSTEERASLAKQLDMSARSVQIWFQNKRQSMRQTNRQSSSAGAGNHHNFSIPHEGESLTENLREPNLYNTSVSMAGPYPTRDGSRPYAPHSQSHSHSHPHPHNHSHASSSHAQGHGHHASSSHSHTSHSHGASSHAHGGDADHRKHWPREF